MIMGRMVPWASLPENADTGADVTENGGKTGSIEAHTETAAEEVNVKDGNTEAGNTGEEIQRPGIQRTATQKKRITSGLR